MAFKIRPLSAVAAAALLAGVAPSFAMEHNLVHNGEFLDAVFSTTNTSATPAIPAGTPATLPFAYGAHTYLCQADSSNQKACNGADFYWYDTGGIDYVATAGTGSPSRSITNYPGGLPYPGYTGNVYVADAGADDANTYLYQQITGLTPGALFAVSFYQADANYWTQTSIMGRDTAYWQVSFTDAPPQYQWVNGVGGSYSLVDPVSTDSPSMDFTPDPKTPGVSNPTGWQKVTVYLTATSSTEYLSFLAKSTSGEPPFALLADVSMVDPPAMARSSGMAASADDIAPAPEPATWAMMGLGFSGIGLAGWRNARKSRQLTAVA